MDNLICLLFHGLGGTPGDLYALGKFLKANKIDIEIPNIKISKDNVINEFINQIEYFIDRYKEKRIIILGHSIGGLVSAHLSIKYKIEKLVLINTPGFIDPKQMLNFKSYYKKEEGLSDITFSEWISVAKYIQGCENIWEKINSPVFIIQGDKDRLVSSYVGIRIYNKLQVENKRIKIVNSAGHNFIKNDIPDKDLFSNIMEFISNSH